MPFRIKNARSGTSLAVQRLGRVLPVQGAWVPSVVRKLGSHMPGGAAKNK